MERGIYTSVNEAKKLQYKLIRGTQNENAVSQPYAWIRCKNGQNIPVYRQGARGLNRAYSLKDDISGQICGNDILRWLVDLGGKAVLPDDLVKEKDSIRDKHNPLSVKYRKN
jgi:hypothetical protein